MPGRHEVAVTASTTASPDEVYAVLCDRASWPSWSRAGAYTLVEGVEGTVGAVARFSIGPVAIVERVVELVPGERFAYALLSGLPVRNYRADVVLTRDGERTRIDWGASFDTAAGLGWAMRALLRRILGDITAALVRRTGS